jgi:hypothetical protein
MRAVGINMALTREEAQAEIRRIGDTIADLRARLRITADARERDRIEQAIRLSETEQHQAWSHAYNK